MAGGDIDPKQVLRKIEAAYCAAMESLSFCETMKAVGLFYDSFDLDQFRVVHEGDLKSWLWTFQRLNRALDDVRETLRDQVVASSVLQTMANHGQYIPVGDSFIEDWRTFATGASGLFRRLFERLHTPPADMSAVADAILTYQNISYEFGYSRDDIKRIRRGLKWEFATIADKHGKRSIEPAVIDTEQHVAPGLNKKRHAKRRSPGRKPKELSKEEKKIEDLWESGRFLTLNDLDEHLEIEWGESKRVLDALRQRRKRAEKRTKKTN